MINVLINFLVGVITAAAFLAGIATHWMVVHLRARRFVRENAWYLSEVKRLKETPYTTVMDWALLLVKAHNLSSFLEGPADDDGDTDAVGAC